MKTCRLCHKEKDLEEFHRRGSGRRNECKECKSKYFKKRKRVNDGHFSVYYLPEHHYVGMTNSIKNRMIEHRSKNNRFTDGYEIIATFDKAVDAHLMETKLHTMGYYGFYYKTFDKKK